MRRAFFYLLPIFAPLAALTILASSPSPAAFTPTKVPELAGRQATIDLPGVRHIRNVGGTDGAGLCVFSATQMAADWQNVREMDGFRSWMERKPGGGWPEKVDQMVSQFCRERGVKVPLYIQHTGGDETFLEIALHTDRMPCVTYAGMDDFYKDRLGRPAKIAHMVNLAYLDSTQACIIDNNRPGVWVWMARAEFLARWRDMDGGWAIVFLAPPPPPHPVLGEHISAPCVCGDNCKCAPGECPAKCPVNSPRSFGQCPGGSCATGQCGSQRSAKPLPAGWKWEDTATGYGLRDPAGNWYLPPDPEYKAQVRSGWSYTPLPEFGGYPRGYWEGNCMRDGGCDGPVSVRVVVGQDGLPVTGEPSPPWNPNDYPGGVRLKCRPCEPTIEVTPIPLTVTPFGQFPSCPTCPNGKCPIPAQPAPATTAPKPVGNPPSPRHVWREIPGFGWGWDLKAESEMAADGSGVVTGPIIIAVPPALDNFGVNSRKIHDHPEYSIGGAKVTGPEAKAALSGGSPLSDDSDRWHLTAVGGEELRAAVRAHVEQLPIGIRGKLLVQCYEPGHWAVIHYKLPAGVSLRKPSPARASADVGVVAEAGYDAAKLLGLLTSAGGPAPVPLPGPKMPDPKPPGPIPNPKPVPVPEPMPKPEPKTPDPQKPDDTPAPPAPSPDRGPLLALLAGIAALVWWLRR